MKISDSTSISMPMRNLLSIVAAVAVGVWAYFGIVERINTLDFSELWNELWSHRNYKQYQVEFENSKAKFENLRGGKYLDLEKIITLAEISYTEKEWGFPKG